MKKQASFLLILLVSMILISHPGFRPAFAYGGGGGGGGGGTATDTSLSDFETGSEVSVTIGTGEDLGVSWDRNNPSGVKIDKTDHSRAGNEIVKSDLHTAAEWVETIGDMSSTGTQTGIYVYAVYCWYVGEAVVLIPVAICWHGPKHITRTIYGLYTGNLDTVHEVNSRSFSGSLANAFIIEPIINYKNVKKGLPPKYPGPNRTHPPEKDIIYFRGVK
ncbi:MAG TPA: hypothetical protein PLM29_01715 [Deltaproteobacteria bacterium]|nr:hypothetical protein [Deltaproteobacteria bacterium]